MRNRLIRVKGKLWVLLLLCIVTLLTYPFGYRLNLIGVDDVVWKVIGLFVVLIGLLAALGLVYIYLGEKRV